MGKKTKSRGGGKGKSRSRRPSTSTSRKQQTHAKTSNLQQAQLISRSSTLQPEDIYEDGILCSILSRLPLKEAVRTCVLSRRWRHMWTYLPRFKLFSADVLDSQILKLLDTTSPLTTEEKYQLLRGQADQFIRSVNSVLQQHQGSQVEEFKVQFFLHKFNSHHLDAWVRFGVDCKTKSFAFYLENPFPEVSEFDMQLYCFPCHLLGPSSIKILALSNCSLKVSNDYIGLNRLTTLLLHAIDITKEEFTHVLTNCPSLKKLGLWNFQKWETLTIPHALSQLRSLVVQDCHLLTRVKIICDNLHNVNYTGVPVEFEFSNSSRLDSAEICFETERSAHDLYFYLTKLLRNMPHLRSLTFHINGVPKVADLPRTFSRFVHLKCLDWTWNADIKMSLLHLTTLLDVAPFLEECKLRLSTHMREQAPQRLKKLTKLLPTHLHSHLKKILISNFCFYKWHIEIALFLLKNAVELELMTIQPNIHNVDIQNLLREIPVKANIVIL